MAEQRFVKRRKKTEATTTSPSTNGKKDRRSRVRNAPLAVDPEGGIWCCAPCPSPIAVTKNLKNLKDLQKQKQKPKPSKPLPPGDSNPKPADVERKALNSNGSPLRLTEPAVKIQTAVDENSNNNNNNNQPQPPQQQQQQRIGYKFNDAESSDVRVSVCGKEGTCVNLNLHIQVLVKCSNLFAAKLAEQHTLPCLLEIVECADMEMYVETLRLMYSSDLKRRLMRESLSRVLRILQVSAAIAFDAGVFSCLEYLEAVPWTEEEEEKVVSFLIQLQLDSNGTGKVLRRVLTENTSGSEDVIVHILQLVTKANNEKARREMKPLVSRMLRENAAQSNNTFDVSNVNLYDACRNCLDLLFHYFIQIKGPNFLDSSSEDRCSIMSQISRQADNLHWLLDILTDRQIADDFVCMWANQSELAALHSKIPIMFRYEVSRLTARLCIAIGKGQVLASKDIRLLFLQTWLQPLIDDYGWIQRACRSLDMKVVEEGICQTILTLPLKYQQNILLSWLNQFLSNADECPNLQKAFEVWWRRTYIRPYIEDE
ncbi:hypothetical protein SUGI_0434160 [Cryptomeria japonica]|uniref:BTB/POZ domain-containing protein At3g50780 n=1 Tax=Cryptomeria japonica TaxID=3369 RepID=UPI00240896C6|nr:BTB/POZ domain-containing protein At3g50780 [Cryptomeria japonica]GLJ23009.1 hypothetical protein SUGI_0434160 [Cryptomeria japonica]